MNNPIQPPPPLDEPSVLDYFKAKLRFWQAQDIQIPTSSPPPEKQAEPAPAAKDLSKLIVWAVLLLALLAQLFFQNRTASLGVLGYAAALGLAVWAYRRGALKLAPLPAEEPSTEEYRFRWKPLVNGLFLALVDLFLFKDNLFTSFNVMIWAVSLGCVLWALWPSLGDWQLPQRLKSLLAKPDWQVNIRPWHVLWVSAFFVAIFFRVYHLGQVVPEMVSDHAEKLLDVLDVLHGQTHIFFPRNTGREGLQMYLTAAVIKLFGTGISFLSLKIGTVAAGIFMLPYMYLLGKEIGNRWVGLGAMFLTGIATWPNVLARVGLRFMLYPALTAPLLFHLLRGLRRKDRRDFIWAGIFLGIGLHGYTPYRIVPILVLLACGLYWLHHRQEAESRQIWFSLTLIVIISLVLFLPLLRYWLDNPEMFAFRAFSRVGSVERSLPGQVWLLFFSNLWNGLRMFNWDDGNIWVVSNPHLPAMAVVPAALFLIGVVLLILRYRQKRDWRDLFLLLAVPLLMMPSVLSLAFPDENPAPNRAGGAMVVAFLVAAIALEAILRALYKPGKPLERQRLLVLTASLLVIFAAIQDYTLTFEKFQEQYTNGAWNTSEMGEVIAQFSATVGGPDQAWVVAYPHWVDNRLVGINSGYPAKNYEIWPAGIVETLDTPAPKLFLFKPEDEAALQTLERVYPEGDLSLHVSDQENKNFYLYYVPAGE